MTSSVVGVNSAPSSQTADSGGLHQILGKKIEKLEGNIVVAEKEIKELKGDIKELNRRLDDNDFTKTGRFSSAERVEAEKAHLQNQLAALQNQLAELQRKENILLQQQQQQQQSGAGASMLLSIERCKCSVIDDHVQACAFSVVWEVQTR